MATPEPWRGTLEASLRLIDALDQEINGCERELRRLGAHHPYVSLLQTCPGIAWVLGYTIAAELGDIARFATPVKLTGYTGLCPKVDQSGERDLRGPLKKNGPRYLRWGLIEAAQHAGSSHHYRGLAGRKRTQYSGPRGKKIANICVARKLTEAIWHMLTRNQPFTPAGATPPLAA